MFFNIDYFSIFHNFHNDHLQKQATKISGCVSKYKIDFFLLCSFLLFVWIV